MQHYCYTIQGWFSYAFLYSFIVDGCNYTDSYEFVEVGSWKGSSTSYMGVEIINSNKKIKFHCVDTWNGSEEHLDENNPSYEPLLKTPDGLYETFLKNIEPVKSVVNPIRKTSVDASFLFEDNSLDFIMIDAAHDYENVKQDLYHWYPKLRVGGIIAGDDITWPGVNRAVDEFFTSEYINHENVVWLKQKR